MTHSILPTANRSGKSGQVKQGRAQGTEASRGLKIWHILSVAEHYLTSAALQRGKPEEGLSASLNFMFVLMSVVIQPSWLPNPIKLIIIIIIKYR